MVAICCRLAVDIVDLIVEELNLMLIEIFD